MRCCQIFLKEPVGKSKYSFGRTHHKTRVLADILKSLIEIDMGAEAIQLLQHHAEWNISLRLREPNTRFGSSHSERLDAIQQVFVRTPQLVLNTAASRSMRSPATQHQINRSREECATLAWKRT
jgi:hypothetical protein